MSTVAQMTDFIRGSRVDDYGPLFALASRLCSLVAAGNTLREQASSAAEGAAERQFLSAATLRLVSAIVGAHGKEVGASAGLAAVSKAAPAWMPLLTHAPVHEVSAASGSSVAD